MTAQTDESQIRELIEHWAQAVRDLDMEAILARHTADMVMFDVPMPLQSRGPDAYRETWELFFQYSKGGPQSFNVIELDVVTSATVAFCHGVLGIMDSRLRLTVGLRKQDDEWRIAHEHHSYPSQIG